MLLGGSTMQRDSRGRFIKGNIIAKGNKGNTHPKWGNKNALKHGLYSTHNTALLDSQGNLCIFLSMNNVIRIPSSHFFVDEQARYRTHNDFANVLEDMGVKLEDD